MTNISNTFFAQLTYHIQRQLTPHPSLLTTIVSSGGDSLSLRRVHERVVHEAPIIYSERRDKEWRRWPRPAVHSEPVSPIRSPVVRKRPRRLRQRGPRRRPRWRHQSGQHCGRGADSSSSSRRITCGTLTRRVVRDGRHECLRIAILRGFALRRQAVVEQEQHG